ncbi:MAG: nucleotidyltransferase domain-containing protein [Chloroflexi bacterium]|nr:nucleotidyltransferase domain-containing protein [Chloroflexota bacterium]
MIVQRPVQALNPERIYLFSSRARGEADPDSDYDILVVVADSQEPRYVWAQAAYRPLWGVGVPVDLLVLTRQEFEQELPLIASLPASVAPEERLLYATSPIS